MPKTVERLITKEERALIQRITSQIYARYCPAGEHGQFDKQDLFHWGVAGLLEAAKRFDESRQVPWLAFAAIRIRGSMMDNLRKAPMIRIPQERYQQTLRLKEKREELALKGKTSDPESLCEALGWDLETVHQADQLSVTLVSADSEREDQAPLTLVSQCENPETAFLSEELAGVMKHCLERLNNATDRLILVSRVLKEMTLKQLAITLGCSIESVRLKQIQAQQEMKICLEKNGWDAK